MKQNGLFTKKTAQAVLKALSFLPAVLMMCMIFGFSAQDSRSSGQLSSQVTVRLVSAWEAFLERGWTSGQIAQYALLLERYIRKAAHMTEYCLLAMTVTIPLLYVYRKWGRRLLPAVGLFCVAFACLDEFHQLFVPGRAAALQDVCFDAVGSLIGICVSHIPGEIRKRLRRCSRSGRSVPLPGGRPGPERRGL